MSVQVSYKKQFTFLTMFFLVLLVPIEGVARTYEYFNPNCYLIEKDAFDKMDKFLVKRMCEEHNSLVFDSRGPIKQNVPNQHSQTININSYGFRGPEITKEKHR